MALAAPPVPPEAVSSWVGITSVWVGPDGSRWDLNNWREGLHLLRDGVKGLHFPKISKSKSVSRAVPGFRLRGHRAESRDVFWPLYVWGGGGEAWKDVYERFFATITPDRPGTWEITAGGVTRRIQLTGVFDEEYTFTVDPYRRGWAIIPISLEAENPFWQGDVIRTAVFGGEEPEDFIPADPEDLDYHPAPTATFSSASLRNPGAVEAWPTWTVRALDAVEPGSITLGLGGVTATVQVPLVAGDTLIIDTDPRNVAALRNNDDVTSLMGLVEWAPIPPGVDMPLSIIGPADAATVQASLIPLHYVAL